MFIHVNQNRVVIDVTEDVKYVGRNEKTGLKVIVLKEDEAIGVIGSDLVIRPLVSSTLTPDFFAVAQVIPVTEIPEDYAPGKYTYNSDGSFEPYEGIVPKTIEELTEEIEEAVKSVFPEWDPNGYSYFAGERVTYKDTFYRCIQNHTSQADWTPEAAPSLWVRISDPSEEWPEWIQPLGSEDAYKKGDKVSHNDKHWISNVDANVWEPGVYGWDAAE